MMSVIIFHRQNKTKPRNVQRANNIGIQFEVKKCTKYENEVLRREVKVGRVPISYGDRFIPRRQYNARTFNSLSTSFDENQHDVFYVKEQPFYWRQHNYRINIGMHLNANVDEKLLNFHDTTAQEILDRSSNQLSPATELDVSNRNVEQLDWSCMPRLKPLSYSESTHDMPGFDEYVNGENIVDWSSQGQIAAGFETSLVIWRPPTHGKESNPIAFNLKNLQALKFSPSGHFLALSLKRDTSILQVAQLNGFKLTARGAPYRLQQTNKTKPMASITCIEWESTEKLIICGMSNGIVHMISYPEMKCVHRLNSIHTTEISNIKYSVYNNYIAISDIDGNLTILHNNSSYDLFLNHKNVDCIAWHPWIETNLLIGCNSPASIHLLDLKTKTTIAHYRRTDTQYSLCAMSINPLSAELVVSFSHQVNGTARRRSEIIVMGSMNRVVDNISAHQDDVYYILWDPTGTKVATIGQDETLNIWHFFGKSQRKADELKKIQDNKKKPVCSHLNLDNSFMQLR